MASAMPSPFSAGTFGSSDVFITGYPKSGNTWLQLLVACLVRNLDPQVTPDQLVQKLVLDVHYMPSFQRVPRRMYFKTHFAPRPEYRRVINIVRDGRDVICSYFHFLEALGNDVSLDRLIDGSELMGFGSWQQHVLEWRKNPFGAEMIVVRYEDLIVDCFAQLVRIADFLGLNASANTLEALAAATAVDRMKKREKDFGWANPAWPSDKPFIRQGIKGAHTREMNCDQIDRFNARAHEALVAFGYI